MVRKTVVMETSLAEWMLTTLLMTTLHKTSTFHTHVNDPQQFRNSAIFMYRTHTRFPHNPLRELGRTNGESFRTCTRGIRQNLT